MDDAANVTAGTASYWPSAGWRTSTPEAQGVNSALLAQMLTHVQEQQKSIHSILIIRYGYLILQAYAVPYQPDTKHNLYSATKSVTSALVGLAMRDGHVQDVHQRVLADIYPDMRVANPDPRKSEMTIAHLLEMTTGLRWNETSISYARPTNAAIRMQRSADWVQFTLGRPMACKPGERFNYNSGASQVLSDIVQKRTGMGAAEYAKTRLFEPLGISEHYWTANKSGLTSGSSGLQLTPLDMARFGYLYLRNGIWDGHRLLPEGWVEESTRPHRHAIGAMGFHYSVRSLLRRLRHPRAPRVPRMDYGYHWWIPSFGGYAARGWGGQAIFVLPALDAVIVFTGGLRGADNFLPDMLIDRYVIPAIESAQPLTANPKSVARLESITAAMAQSRQRPVPPLPPLARDISGRRYVMKARGASLASFSITFTGNDEALLAATQSDTHYEVTVGLDDKFRINRIGDQDSLALKGHWADEKTFVLDWRPLAAGDRLTLTLTFDGHRVKFYTKSAMTGRTESAVGRLQS